jgi:hypothetical protein
MRVLVVQEYMPPEATIVVGFEPTREYQVSAPLRSAQLSYGSTIDSATDAPLVADVLPSPHVRPGPPAGLRRARTGTLLRLTFLLTLRLTLRL